MKKTILLAVAIMAASVLGPAPQPAHAAGVDAVISALTAQNQTAAQLQNLMRLKDQLNQGDKDALLGLLTQTALEKAGRGDIAQLASTAAAGQDLRAAVETAVRQEVEGRVTAKLGNYTDTAALLGDIIRSGALAPKAAAESDALAGAPENYRRMLQMTATAYAPGYRDNGPWNDRTYIGTKIRKGVAAVDPTVIPLGSRLWVEGYGEAVAEDVGSAIKGNRIDLAFADRNKALDYGMKPARVYVLQ